MISPIPNPSDYAHPNDVLSPAQSQLQDHLQRKHEELQKIIIQQQDELRRVSEQLFIARYGILPSLVQVPFVATIEQEQSNDISSEGSQCMSTSSHMVHSTYYESTPPQLVHMVPPQQYQQQLSSNHQQQQHDSRLSQQPSQLQSFTEMKPIETHDGSEQAFNLQSTHQQQSNQSQSNNSEYDEIMSYHMLSPWDNNQQQQQPQQTQQSQSNQQESAN